MSTPAGRAVPPFAVIPGGQVQQALAGRERQVAELVEATYRLHGAGDSVNPPSYFLRFPDRPSDRIIALPASLGGPRPVDGLKWISSFPGNVTAGIPRASAVLILNDHDTGYPFACLESSIISATRTAASAAVAADWLTRGRPRPAAAGFIGTGLIARYIHTYLAGTGWTFDQTGVHDPSPASTAGFRGYLEHSGAPGRITIYDDPGPLIRASDLIIFATIAGQPHITDPSWFTHNPLVLHISLRDLTPQILLTATNIVDDIDHCLKAATSPTWPNNSPATATSWPAPSTTSSPDRSPSPPAAPPSSPPSASASSTWPSANTSTTRSPAPATSTSSTTSSTTCTDTDEPGPSGGGRDVVVHAEEVLRVVPGLEPR